MSDIKILCPVPPDILAEEVCDSLSLGPGVIDFIMLIDAYMADTSFTEELIERLTGALNEEEKFNGTYTA